MDVGLSNLGYRTQSNRKETGFIQMTSFGISKFQKNRILQITATKQGENAINRVRTSSLGCFHATQYFTPLHCSVNFLQPHKNAPCDHLHGSMDCNLNKNAFQCRKGENLWCPYTRQQGKDMGRYCCIMRCKTHSKKTS